jgi:hypothetical protein
MGEYEPGTVLVDHNIILNNGDRNTYTQDASGVLYLNNIIGKAAVSGSTWVNDYDSGAKRGTLIWQVTDRTRSDNNGYYNNIYVGSGTHFWIPYPTGKSSGGQRFLGNLYDTGDQGMWRIQNYTRPRLSDADFTTAVNALLGAPAVISGSGTNREARLTFAEWKTFWSSFWTGNSARSDGDAAVMDGLAAVYEPATQTLRLTLPSLPARLDNTRWDAPYKAVFHRPIYGATPFGGADETAVYPGPFASLNSGENVIQIWHGLAPVAEDALPAAFQ